MTLYESQVAQFHSDGYLVIENLFDPAEMDLLLKIAKADQAMARDSYGRKDTQGGVSKLWLSYELGDDIYSTICRTSRVVEPLEQLLGRPIFHFHHKMMQKEPYVGGAWEWHQDYGYWYRNEGFLFPDMASCLIAVDRAIRENGCLQVIRGSHRLGRIEHGMAADQVGADPARVEGALKQLELVYCELSSGSALFFHGNLLHASAQNKSPNPRWSFIGCYSTVDNPTLNRPADAYDRNLVSCEDDDVLRVGHRTWNEMQLSIASPTST
ncbi:MAG: phytanoyl-CoA dioxygenase family protein [Pirellulales bacterium]|nr:phytanoyl-CoA dioxygenase family protein [Pirellulales bacterium]